MLVPLFFSWSRVEAIRNFSAEVALSVDGLVELVYELVNSSWHAIHSIYNNYDLCWSGCLAYRSPRALSLASLARSLAPQKELQWPRHSRQAHRFLLTSPGGAQPTSTWARIRYRSTMVVRLFASLPLGNYYITALWQACAAFEDRDTRPILLCKVMTKWAPWRRYCMSIEAIKSYVPTCFK